MRKHPHSGENTRNSKSTNRIYSNNTNPAMERLREAIRKAAKPVKRKYTKWQQQQIEQHKVDKLKAKGQMFWNSDKQGTYVRR